MLRWKGGQMQECKLWLTEGCFHFVALWSYIFLLLLYWWTLKVQYFFVPHGTKWGAGVWWINQYQTFLWLCPALHSVVFIKPLLFRNMLFYILHYWNMEGGLTCWNLLTYYFLFLMKTRKWRLINISVACGPAGPPGINMHLWWYEHKWTATSKSVHT